MDVQDIAEEFVDYWVARGEGVTLGEGISYSPSTDIRIGVDILEREQISVSMVRS